MSVPSDRLRANGVIYADQVEVGDIVFASYHVPAADRSRHEALRDLPGPHLLVCAWVQVEEIKHHTESTVTLLSRVLDGPGSVRWVEYPLGAPLVLGLLP